MDVGEFEAAEVERLPVYIDGADEIDGRGHMIKGGGAALTREKIVAALAALDADVVGLIELQNNGDVAAQLAAARGGMTRMSGGGKVEQLPGDADSAYLHDMQDNGTSLHYLRQNVRIQLHATSGAVPFATMKPRLLALRRVP